MINDTNNDDLTRVRYVSKLIRVKHGRKSNKFRTDMRHDERIDKDFWKYCKEIFESEDTFLPDFDETMCDEHFIKSLKKHNCSRDYSSPLWMKNIHKPTSLFDLSQNFHKMRSSGSACLLDHPSIIALKRCLILRSALHHIIVCCWQNNIIPGTWKRNFCVLIYKKVSPKQLSNFSPITLEPVCAKVFTSLIHKIASIAILLKTTTSKLIFQKCFGRESLVQ